MIENQLTSVLFYRLVGICVPRKKKLLDVCGKLKKFLLQSTFANGFGAKISINQLDKQKRELNQVMISNRGKLLNFLIPTFCRNILMIQQPGMPSHRCAWTTLFLKTNIILPQDGEKMNILIKFLYMKNL